ncbi:MULTISPECIES: hypothetical protein [Dokdonia]|uniref:Arginyl-tRNA synthetase n=1 Tax=Dokdonia donghaensis DSW-1 TaxID=1300343 RepID=A0A0A2GSK1_9FLAO|nr:MULTISPECIES: hypothetical protein [Dokdonia]ANH61689.1 hypothetical protein I597_2798 [Dokdonia donghaensis DSW-1]KGO06279.1 arginyl-tRNA synthetase [Dokdonia donghaensis DSW-1]MDE0598153.1 hypothetical protein [Dokdonia donghaensis]
MLLNVSYNNPDVKRKINEEVGEPYGLRERIKQGGIGIGHLVITESSIQIQNFLALDKYRNKCNIELRPRGIIIGFRALLDSYALVIPYWKLNLYKGRAEEYSVYRDNYFIKIEAKAKDKKVHNFMKRILDQKAQQSPTNIDDL